MKNENAVSKYGEKGKYGAIEIITEEITVTALTDNDIDTIKPVIKDKIFTQVEVEPVFPGGNEKWREYLKRNLKATIPLDKHAPKGTYTAVIQFVVDTAGYI